MTDIAKSLRMAETLSELQPTDTYSQRALARLTDHFGWLGFHLTPPEGDVGHVVSGGRGLNHEDSIVRMALAHRGRELGTLAVSWPARVRSTEGEREMLAAGRLLARGLYYATELATSTTEHPGDAVSKALDSSPLTPRERDVVVLLVAGSSTKSIAELTGLTISTVNTYLKRIFAKIGVHSRIELVAAMTGTASMTPSPRRNSSASQRSRGGILSPASPSSDPLVRTAIA